MSANTIETLQQAIASKEKEIEALRIAISTIQQERQKTCTHPNEQRTMAEKWCPDCGWHKERSF